MPKVTIPQKKTGPIHPGQMWDYKVTFSDNTQVELETDGDPSNIFPNAIDFVTIGKAK